MSKNKHICYSIIYIIFILINCVACHSHGRRTASIKKQLPNGSEDVMGMVESSQNTENQKQHEGDITISDKSQLELQTDSLENPRKNYQRALYAKTINIEDYKSGFIGFIILSAAAILFFIYKSYILRSSRAERKYGVQGDRSTQELTPLPVALEDGNSDDEDHTIFELKNQPIVL